MPEGWEGWDEYAPFYDWENARTLGRRDVPFWRRLARRARGPVLELGCGTGRISYPLAKAGVNLVGVDRSAPMLARARDKFAAPRRSASPPSPLVSARSSVNGSRERCAGTGGGIGPSSSNVNLARALGALNASRPASAQHAYRLDRSQRAPRFVRADIRRLPFGPSCFSLVLAPYGVLQSVLADDDLAAVFRSVGRVLTSDGTFAMELVPDVPNWRSSRHRVQLQGATEDGGHLVLIESVRQHRRRKLTTFHERFIERSTEGRRDVRFDLTFRTLSVRAMADRLERTGFHVDSLLGDYAGGPWSPRSDAWIIVARQRRFRESAAMNR